jgi:hypothetical protein
LLAAISRWRRTRTSCKEGFRFYHYDDAMLAL